MRVSRTPPGGADAVLVCRIVPFRPLMVSLRKNVEMRVSVYELAYSTTSLLKAVAKLARAASEASAAARDTASSLQTATRYQRCDAVSPDALPRRTC